MTAPTKSPSPSNLTKPSDREIRVERVFNATRERVWQAYTDPKLLAQWWGRGNKLVIERYELERGGHWRFVEHSDHGVDGFEGRYREVTPPERISMTFEWDGMPGHPIVSTAVFCGPSPPPTGLVRVSSTVSGPSTMVSFRMGTANVRLVTPGAKVRVPAVVV